MFTSYHGSHSCHWLFQGFLISDIMVSIFDGELFIMLRSQSFNLYMVFMISTIWFYIVFMISTIWFYMVFMISTIWFYMVFMISTFGFIWFSWYQHLVSGLVSTALHLLSLGTYMVTWAIINTGISSMVNGLEWFNDYHGLFLKGCKKFIVLCTGHNDGIYFRLNLSCIGHFMEYVSTQILVLNQWLYGFHGLFNEYGYWFYWLLWC